MGEESTRAEVDALRGRGGRRTINQMVIVGLIATLLGIALGLVIDWFPTAGSRQAGPIVTTILLIPSRTCMPQRLRSSALQRMPQARLPWASGGANHAGDPRTAAHT